MLQWLRICLPKQVDTGLIPGPGTKISYAVGQPTPVPQLLKPRRTRDHIPQLEKAHRQQQRARELQRRPSPAPNKQTINKIKKKK